MRRFPVREADLMGLAQQLIAGLARQAADFPSPPLSPAELQARQATDAKRAAGDFWLPG